jgi:rare lipoprotein A
LATGCGSKQKPQLDPPTPAMPPGVSWGPPAAALPAPAAVAPRKEEVVADAGTHYEPPPTAHPPMPAGNYDPHYRSGGVWETGIASFYGPREQGRDTASGEKFDFHKMTAAHRLLPLGTEIKVTDLKTQKTVQVTINDRGPFWPNRLLDLSWGAAKKIGDDGLDPVRIEIVHLPSPVPPGVYTVQVGWFTNSGQLDQCRRRMENDLHDPVIAFGSDEGRWLRYDKRIRLDMGTATNVARSLRAENYPAYVVRLN